jgi:hypothetical protein
MGSKITMNMKNGFFASLTVFFLAGCTSFVKLTPEGEDVRIGVADTVISCQMTGTTTVEILAKVIVNRSPEKVALELRSLARNRAADRGDTIVEAGAIKRSNGDASQTFNIYRCN